MASNENSFPWTADWTDYARYAYINRVTNDGVAWEYLRRNDSYIATWERTGLSKPTLEHQACRTEIQQLSGAAQPWGLLSFEDPRRDAIRARVLWSPDSSSLVLPVYAIAPHCASDLPAFDLAQLNCEVVLVIENGTVRHVLFAEQSCRLQLALEGGDIFNGARLLTEIPRGCQLLRHRLELVRRLSDLAEHGCLNAQLYEAEPRGDRRPLLLQALDGKLAGASHREIAIALFGRERVDAEWNAPGEYLRSRVRRAIQRATWLMKRGYLNLLR